MLDYGAFSTTNRDLDTGIRYGIIALNNTNLHEELFDLPNPSEDEALAEFAREVLTEKIREGKVDAYDLDMEPECDDWNVITTDDLEDHLHNLTDEQVVDLLDQLFPNEKDWFWDGRDMDLVGAEGEIDGVKVRVTELGGAYLLWVFKSPHLGWYRPASICVPGAGDLDSPVVEEDGVDPSWEGVLTYDVPAEWRVLD